MSEAKIIEFRRAGGRYTEIILPTPPIGGKTFVLDRQGVYVLERGPGTLRTIACTHAGCGSMVAIDGFPDENGFVADEDKEGEASLDPARAAYNGRAIYRANPVVMGSWMLDAGFFHGLTISHPGEGPSAVASVVWVPFRRRT